MAFEHLINQPMGTKSEKLTLRMDILMRQQLEVIAELHDTKIVNIIRAMIKACLNNIRETPP